MNCETQSTNIALLIVSQKAKEQSHTLFSQREDLALEGQPKHRFTKCLHHPTSFTSAGDDS